MGYTKVVSYGNIIEVYRYEKDVRANGRKKGLLGQSSLLPHIPEDGKDAPIESKPQKVRTEAHARRARVAFRRLVGANIDGVNHPVLASFTYTENMVDIGTGRKDWRAFARRGASLWGESFRWVCVAEFQRRGAVHFHALIWGIPESVIDSERHARVVASLWGRGFTDVVRTDGSHKLAGYLAKYMSKMFLDPRMSGRKAYICSQNFKRPFIDKNALLLPYHTKETGYPQIPGAETLQKTEYSTQWLGMCNYQKYKTT